MTSSDLPGRNAVRNGAADRLLAMNAAHAAFRRDLESLARAATPARLDDPLRRESIANGWKIFKNQLYKHHEGEDRYIWPRLRERLATSENALSTLDEMDAEHAMIDPLLAAVDNAFDGNGDVAAVVDELISKLSHHLSHEERDAMPMIGEALSDEEWDAVMADIRGAAGPAVIAEYLPWLTDGVSSEQEERITTIVPPPVRGIYHQVWKPEYDKMSKW